MDKEFYLIRHAQSMSNVGLDSGYDADLSPLGHVQAKQCAELMHEYCDNDTLILSSPFERCIVTAEAIASFNQLTVTLLPELHELFADEWFVMNKIKLPSLQQKAEQHSFVVGTYSDDRWWPQDNETSKQLDIRMAMLRNRLLSNEFQSEKIICIGHWASIASLACSMLPEMEIPVVENAGVTGIDYTDGCFSLNFINKTL